jgi:arylsulfatase A-like enzyme
MTMADQPNVVLVFADQWRAQATGYAGDPNAVTPHLDALAKESLNFNRAVSGCPVCTPYRGSLITGQYWLRHGAFLNDVCLRDDDTSLAEAFTEAGYNTGYIGKWHLDGHGRSAFIPKERRQGFEYWNVLECTHNYNKSMYYSDTPEKKQWFGYDAIAQTRAAEHFIRKQADDKPFLLVLSWGGPHNPYETAPQRYRKRFKPAKMQLRPNVPKELEAEARKELAGYHAHINCLDECVGDLLKTLEIEGKTDDTIFVFTSDHGDMIRSQGQIRKQKPYEESIRIPFLLRYPKKLGKQGRELTTLINTPDIMPTLLGLAGAKIPESVDGTDFSPTLLRNETPEVDGTIILCPTPFGEWRRDRGGREYRGIVTERYTYTRDLKGAWLLYDNQNDPYQQENLANQPAHAALQSKLDTLLNQKLADNNDEFLHGDEYIKQWNYAVNEHGTMPTGP